MLKPAGSLDIESSPRTIGRGGGRREESERRVKREARDLVLSWVPKYAQLIVDSLLPLGQLRHDILHVRRRHGGRSWIVVGLRLGLMAAW